MNEIHLNIGVCSHWGRKLPKHIFKTQLAPIRGHRFCLNCGMSKKEVREEELFNGASLMENRIFNIHYERPSTKHNRLLCRQDA